MSKKNLSRSFIPLLFVIIASLCGCATVDYATPYSANSSPSPSEAFIYGRFKFTEKYSVLRLALGLTNLRSNEEVNIRFDEGSGICIVPVKPGEYQITHRVVALLGASTPQESNKRPFKPPILPSPFKVESGKAFYIGDYYGWTRFGQFQVIRTTFNGEIEKSEKNFKQTTLDFKSEFPKFNNIPTVDLLDSNQASK